APSVIDNEHNPTSEAKIALGRMLYFEDRLSKSKHISCNSCHFLDRYGVDGLAVSTGHGHQKGARNAPSVYFAAGHKRQFGDGRAADVEEQAKGPVLNPIEMAMPDAHSVETTLRAIPGYVDAFRRAFPKDKEPVTFDNAARAIAAFERRL